MSAHAVEGFANQAAAFTTAIEPGLPGALDDLQTAIKSAHELCERLEQRLGPVTTDGPPLAPLLDEAMLSSSPVTDAVRSATSGARQLIRRLSELEGKLDL